MAITDLDAEVMAGPYSGTTWYDEGMAGSVFFNKATAAVASTTLEQACFTVPTPNLVIAPGQTYQPALRASTDALQNCYGVYVVADATWAANIANLTMFFSVRRAGAVVGGGGFAGWAAASNPAFTAFTPVFVPFIANTALQPGQQGGTVGTTFGSAFMPLRPLDVITASFVTTASVTPTSVLNVYLVLI